MLATEDSYEELDYDLSVEEPITLQRERLASGTIASMVEKQVDTGSVEEVATEATELEVIMETSGIWGTVINSSKVTLNARHTDGFYIVILKCSNLLVHVKWDSELLQKYLYLSVTALPVKLHDLLRDCCMKYQAWM